MPHQKNEAWATWDLGLKGRVALVTGGWRGIGRATVDCMVVQGVRVAFSFVPGVEPAAEIEAMVAAAPQQLSAHPLDLRDTASIAACVAGAQARWGGIDILVNNAAVGSATVAGFADDADAQDSAMLQINAVGTLLMCKAFLAARGTDAEPRKLISIASVGGGITQFPGFRLSDGMSKAAVAMMTRQLAAEQVHSTTDVFALCPGATNTAMFQASTLNKMTAEDRRAFVARLPKGRLIEPAEIADLVLFLASRLSTPMHGAVIDASMGLGVRPGLLTEFGH
jgi:NAD(P)-dependent dehydrogenase (short-subunit alcohol dehydrogenase family)